MTRHKNVASLDEDDSHMGKRYYTVITEHIYPSIPIRQFDWSAVTDNYEPGMPIGYGTTEQSAIDDLLELLSCS